MIKILLAEDDSSMREYLARALERVGYSVKAVGCGTEAMPLLESESCVILF
jgi:two-component system cell cycle response regulator CpdR